MRSRQAATRNNLQTYASGRKNRRLSKHRCHKTIAAKFEVNFYLFKCSWYTSQMEPCFHIPVGYYYICQITKYTGRYIRFYFGGAAESKFITSI